ncbi:MAG: endonuclease/exonuclease/phosphatase family protein [Hyphomicrobiaceae bacterium]|nr:endonuclease/exonuclease/phosphatase family protein [Hyphomicrobiaceae bacterium]
MPKSLSVLSWNVGYAGLGRESDFFKDGGRGVLPPSRRVVRKNLAGIKALIAANPVDALFLQEVSDNSPLSWWVPVRRDLEALLGDRQNRFDPDTFSILLPWPLQIRHGLMMSLLDNVPVRFDPLPPEEGWRIGPVRRRFGYQTAVLEGDPRWVLINLHLSAFDDGQIRDRQLAQVLDVAHAHFEAGAHVVVGGDWNLIFAQPGWPHQTDLEHLFWIRHFDFARLPDGWRMAADEKVPTVRTNQKPYVKGENFTSTIDGFLVSPNVRVDAVGTIDTEFEHTDHMPVIGRFSARD